MRYLSIDIETTGLSPTKHQVLEVGVVLEDTNAEQPVLALPSFRAVLLREDYSVSSYCLGLHARLFQEINDASKRDLLGTHYVPPSRLQLVLKEFLADNDYEGDLRVAGKNFFAFDHGFLAPLLPLLRFDYRSLDPAPLFLRNEDKRVPSLPECCARAGIDLTGYHTAVGDARTVVNLIRVGMKRRDQ